ncbi:Alpha/beta hydrolase fold-3 [Kalmanozyma brasiliensis GHG001]|uniref:Alpha/beta hydrolase fold-3 domain-containing protein n=1 Tax=Kalmanozyma brasiliensis (strain GHG001) TaxID=1365824 RepID=V5EWB4_KALBG|nr:Alpha/beta hydrolase fold-3 [Kalmanozyma brasiliensis GHG001]EST06569.1 Alpha/beta hydrolase fold-3 [Kalmanozyma brasiliensis GHG001]
MGHSILSPWYWLLKLAATFFRGTVYLRRGTERYLRNRPLPSSITREVLRVPSRDKGRSIGVDLYRPAGGAASSTLPVIVNWHGSGYLIPSWGEDREYIVQAVKALGCIVLDCDYRKGPEYPYPSGHNDAEDVVKWVLSQSDRFDVTKVALSGFSAGAALALTSGNKFGPQRISAVSCLYPPVDVAPTPPERPTPYQPRSGIHLKPAIVGLFNSSYVPILSTRQEPKFRIRGLDTSRFPNRLFIACGDVDLLHNTAHKYFEEVKHTEKDKRITWVSVEREEHAWDKMPVTPESVKARDDVYRGMFDNIRASWSG